jgi:uncharacterized membrane protein YkoI
MHDGPMRSALGVFVLIALLWAGAGPARADCLPMRQARDLVRSGEAIPLAAAMRAARGAAPGEMIDGKLCRGGSGLQYVVTILGPEGRVVRVTLDAKSGSILEVR